MNMFNWIWYFFCCVLFIGIGTFVVYGLNKALKGITKTIDYKINIRNLFLLIVDNKMTAKDVGFKSSDQKEVDKVLSKTVGFSNFRMFFKIFASVIVIDLSAIVILLYPLYDLKFFVIIFTSLSAICALCSFVFLENKSKFFITLGVMFYTFSQLFVMLRQFGYFFSNILCFIVILISIYAIFYSQKKYKF